MHTPPLHPRETERLEVLAEYRIVDTEPEIAFDDLTALAASICRCPMSVVSLVDAKRQWFKSRVGIEATETPREVAFCAQTILQSAPLVVEDAHADPRFSDNPLVRGPLGIRFYAGVPLVGPEGLPVGVLAVLDREARALGSAEVDALVRLARQATAQLELRRARVQAERAHAVKRAFLATMSHEVRTPLNGVLGMSQLLLDTPLSAEQRECAMTVRQSGQHLLSIINDVLDYSKIDSGKVRLEHASFDLREVADRAMACVRDAAVNKGLDLGLTYKVSTGATRIGDGARLRQVVENLLGNAVKFTHHGSVRLSVEDGSSPGSIRIAVEDTGIGIAPEFLKELFDHFTQADSTMTRSYGGIGLGLAISRELVRLMGGRIEVESTVGRGSRFWFDVMLTSARSAATPSGAADDAQPTDRLRGLAVLVVEDSKVNQLFIKRALARFGCEVTLVMNGVAAVEAANGTAFDVILMDCQMPEMDGFEATRVIRAGSGPCRDAPILALTAGVLDEDRQRCFEVGMNDFLTKPIEPAVLAAALVRATEAKTSGVQLAAEAVELKAS